VSTVELPAAPAPAVPLLGASDRSRLVRRAKLLAWLGVAWHGIEAAIAVGAGVAAGSIALIGFGADSLIESVAGIVLLWRFGSRRAASETAERRAQQLIGLSFFLLAVYVGAEAFRTLLGGNHPHVSWVGIGLSAFTLATMPVLARAKARVGEQLGSSATKSEGRQNMLCAYLSAGLLIGLGGNALFGLWWLDPAAAALIAAVAVKEGREAWRGESCCTTPIVGAGGGCDDDCCP
jgi:divalent metal cation (Fe/Co/Zn/Cd) transporter